MKLKFLLYTCIIWFTFSVHVQAQRLVGYLPSYATTAVLNTNVQYNKLTDIIFCFINPDASGTGTLIVDRVGNANFDFEMEKLQIVKSRCFPIVANGPKLWIALGGADGGNLRATRIAGLCATLAGRTGLATNLVNFAITHDLEGIDLDWEFPTPGVQATNLSLFIVELRARINASTNTALKISIAVGGETVGGCTSGHLPYFDATVAGATAAVDYFHIMTYDLPASYNANHSLLTNGNTSLDNWSTCKGIPKSKMCMGVPFYGRNAARTLIQNYNLMAAGANAGDNVGGTYYYNGDATIAAKIDAVRTTHAGAGIMIWDVAMDKTDASGESLLSKAYVKMFGNAATNPCSTRPYMGKDTTMCITGSPALTLNPVVNTTGLAGTRTFAWTRNSIATGGNTNTLAITQGGTYKVTITQGPTNCILTDEIIVSEQTDATTPTASPTFVCAAGTASSTLTSSASVQWYTRATSGAAFATGTSTVVTPSVTTTYYTQGAPTPTNKKYYAGRPAIATNALWMELTRDATQTTRPEWVQQLTVEQPLTLKSVIAYFKSNAVNNPVTIMVMDASTPGSTTLATVPTQVSANTTSAISVPARSFSEPWGVYPVILAVNITFQPGTYYVGVYNPDGDAVAEGAGLEINISHPSSMPGVYTIGSTGHQNYGGGYGVAGVHYGQLFDWRIESAALSQCTRKSVIVTYDCTLPVELLNFSGINNDHKNFLSWSTSNEINNNYFNIERSDNANNYAVIGSVKGNGNSNEILNYSIVDPNPLAGDNYYRLAQYDFDGSVNYSAAIIVDNSNILYQISPNPFDSEITVKSNGNHGGKLQITNIQGSVVHEEYIFQGNEVIKLGNNFTAGIYFLKIQDGNSSYIYKIIKR